MATTIVQSVLAKFATSGITDFSATGGLWLEEAPESVSLPIAGFTNNNETLEYSTELEYKETGTFDFDVYAAGIAETERLALLIKSLYDKYIRNPRGMDFIGGKVVNWERVSGRTGVEGQRKDDNAQVGHTTFTYAYTVERTLPQDS